VTQKYEGHQIGQGPLNWEVDAGSFWQNM